MGQQDSTVGRPRLIWADAAKGAAVVAVVLVHVVTKHVMVAGWDTSELVHQWWAAAVVHAAPVRVPLFFVVSGYFGARAVQRGWRDLLSGKVGFFYYVYLVWVVVQTAVLRLTPGFDTAVAHDVPAFVAQITVAPTNLWYLFALAVFFPIAKAGLRAPRVTSVLAAVLAASPVAGAQIGGNLGQLPKNLVWFLLGCYASAWLTSWVARITVARLLGVVVLFVVLMAAKRAVGQPVVGLHVAASAAGALLGIAAAVMVARWFPRVSAGFARVVGRNTLPVYVMQMPLIALWHTWVTSADGVGAVGGVGAALEASPALLAVYPLLLTAAVTAVSLALHRVLRPSLPFLFQKPRLLHARRRGRETVACGDVRVRVPDEPVPHDEPVPLGEPVPLERATTDPEGPGARR